MYCGVSVCIGILEFVKGLTFPAITCTIILYELNERVNMLLRLVDFQSTNFKFLRVWHVTYVSGVLNAYLSLG